MNPHEEGLSQFVVPHYRRRFRESLAGKRRDKLLASLAAFAYLDDRFAQPVKRGHRLPDEIYATLIQLGALERCYVVSAADELDRQEFPLLEALQRIVGQEMGTFISCIPGQLAYFEGEELSDRYILKRTVT